MTITHVPAHDVLICDKCGTSVGVELGQMMPETWWYVRMDTTQMPTPDTYHFCQQCHDKLVASMLPQHKDPA